MKFFLFILLVPGAYTFVICNSQSGVRLGLSQCSSNETLLFGNVSSTCEAKSGILVCNSVAIASTDLRDAVYNGTRGSFFRISSNGTSSKILGGNVGIGPYNVLYATDQMDEDVQHIGSPHRTLEYPGSHHRGVPYIIAKETCIQDVKYKPLEKLPFQDQPRHTPKGHFISLMVAYFFTNVTEESDNSEDYLKLINPAIHGILSVNGNHIINYSPMSALYCTFCNSMGLCQVHVYLTTSQECLIHQGNHTSRILTTKSSKNYYRNSTYIDFHSYGFVSTGYKRVKHSCPLAPASYCVFGGKCNSNCASKAPSRKCHEYTNESVDFSAPHRLSNSSQPISYSPLIQEDFFTEEAFRLTPHEPIFSVSTA